MRFHVPLELYTIHFLCTISHLSTYPNKTLPKGVQIGQDALYNCWIVDMYDLIAFIDWID